MCEYHVYKCEHNLYDTIRYDTIEEFYRTTYQYCQILILD